MEWEHGYRWTTTKRSYVIQILLNCKNVKSKIPEEKREIDSLERDTIIKNQIL